MCAYIRAALFHRGASSTRTASPSSDLIMFFIFDIASGRTRQMRTLDGEALNFTIFTFSSVDKWNFTSVIVNAVGNVSDVCFPLT